jgi:hypothetical protein
LLTLRPGPSEPPSPEREPNQRSRQTAYSHPTVNASNQHWYRDLGRERETDRERNRESSKKRRGESAKRREEEKQQRANTREKTAAKVR